MVIKRNGKGGDLFGLLNQNHKERILKLFNPSNPRELLQYRNPEFTKTISNPNIEPFAGQPIADDQFCSAPPLVYLGLLTDLSFYLLPKSKAGTPGNTSNLCVGSFRSTDPGSCTTIVPNIVLDNHDNDHSVYNICKEFDDFRKNKMLELLKIKPNNYDEEMELESKRLAMEYAKFGFTINLNNRKGFTTVRIVYEPTNEVVTDRTVATY